LEFKSTKPNRVDIKKVDVPESTFKKEPLKPVNMSQEGRLGNKKPSLAAS